LVAAAAVVVVAVAAAAAVAVIGVAVVGGLVEALLGEPPWEVPGSYEAVAECIIGCS